MACKYKYKDKWYSEEEVRKEISKDTSVDQVLTEFLSSMSYTIEINTAKEKYIDYIKDVEEFTGYENEYEIEKETNTQHYSSLTVPGGTNYTERNFETPLIKVPKSHAQFNTENTIGFTRGDDRTIYTENDIESLLSIMQNSGILKIKCD